MRKKAIAWAVAIGSLATTALFAQELAPSVSPDPAETDILSYEKRGNLMAVAVTVTGQGPYTFLVDSGAERTIISRELVERLALQRGKSVRIQSMTTSAMFTTAHIPRLQFSKRQVNDIHAPQLPAAYIGAAGVLGVDSLRRQRVEFDFANRRMTVTTSRAEPAQWSRDAIVVMAKSLFGRLVLTDAHIEGIKVLAVIDTGSDLSVANRALQRALAKKGKLRPTVPLEVQSVTGQRFMVDYTQAGKMVVGDGLTISNMPVGFADAQIFRQLRLEDKPVVMLGMDTLSLFARLSVDFARKEVRFQLPEPGSPGRLAMAE